MDEQDAWYHGASLELRTIRAGSTITRKRELARVFSHKPQQVSVDDAGNIRHNGKQPGYLYIIAETVRSGDVTPHPRSTMAPGDEWITTRELRVRFLGSTVPRPEELLTEAEIAELYRRKRE